MSGDPDHLAWARELAEVVRRDFARAEGAFFQTRTGVETPLGRRVELFDSVLPSGCAAAISLLLRLGALTGDEALTAEAQHHLRGQLGLLRRAGTDMAAWLDAALLVIAPLYSVVVEGDPADPRTGHLVRAVLATWPPQVVLTRAPAGGQPRGQACRRGICLAPTAVAEDLAAAVRQGWYR